MTGRSPPVTGAETRTSRSTARPGAGSTTGETERTGAGEPNVSAAYVDSLMMRLPLNGLCRALPEHAVGGGRGGQERPASVMPKRSVVPFKIRNTVPLCQRSSKAPGCGAVRGCRKRCRKGEVTYGDRHFPTAPTHVGASFCQII